MTMYRRLRRLWFKALAEVAYLGLLFWSGFRPVRIGFIIPKSRLTILPFYLEPYLRELEAKGMGHALVVAIDHGFCSNDTLCEMYRRRVCLLGDDRPRARALFTWLLRGIFMKARSRVDAELGGYHERFHRHWIEGRTQISFTAQDLEHGAQLRSNLGIQPPQEYVCLALRENAYYKAHRENEGNPRHPNFEVDAKYWVRNPDLSSYLPMMQELSAAGLAVLRMGSVVGEAMPDLGPRVLDYANRCRTPFGDIFLPTQCKFFITGAAGLWIISTVFHRPVVFTDAYTLQFRAYRKGDLLIPQLLWSKQDKRLLSFREMMDFDYMLTNQGDLDSLGVEIVKNTPEEISSVVREMALRLQGAWVGEPQDEELAQRLAALYAQSSCFGRFYAGSMGAEFLRCYKQLLD